MYGSDHRGNPVHAGKVTNDFFKRNADTNKSFSGNYRPTPRLAAMSGMDQGDIDIYRKMRDYLGETDERTGELLTEKEYPESEAEEVGLDVLHTNAYKKGVARWDEMEDMQEELAGAFQDRHLSEYDVPSADNTMLYPQGTKIQTGFYPGSPRAGQADPRSPEQRYKALAPKKNYYN